MTAYPCAAGGAGSQSASTGGKGYAGLIGYIVDPITAPSNANDSREYIAQNVSLTAGTVYYAGFKANIAAASGYAIDRLGLAFTTLPPIGYTSGNFYFVQGAYTGNAPIPLTPTISGPVADVPVASWNNIQGFFMATGNETQMIIGNFGPGYGTVPPYTSPYRPGPSPRIFSRVDNSTENLAYYFIEDVTLQTLPTAGPELTAVCGQTVRLGACGLPALPGVSYSWSPATGLDDPNSAMPLLTTTMNTPANTAWHYTLTVTVPLPGGQLYTTSSSVDVTVSQSPPITITPSFTGTYCANAPITLTATGGLPGVTYNWSWPSPTLPNVTMTATGPTLNVSPSITTAYTLTSGCQQAAYTANVSPNCCYIQQLVGTNQYTKLRAKPYIYTASPFTGGPGAYYYVAGTLRLENVSCTLPVGSVLLVGDGINSNVELGPNAELFVDGATITAACDDMWGGLVVEGQAVGIHADDASGEPVHVSHSYNGIVLKEADPGVTPPYFHLENIRFDHNRQSVEIHRLTAPASSGDYIINSKFDSKPSDFKKPWKDTGPDGPHYSLRHIGITGDVLAADISYNSFKHTIYGVSNLGDPAQADVRLVQNTFNDCYLAGVVSFVQGVQNFGYHLYELQDNIFTFPTGATLPQFPQIQQEVAKYNGVGTYPEDWLDGTFGLYLHGPYLRAIGNRFQQIDSTSVGMDDYNAFASVRPRQTGIYTDQQAKVHNNSFYLLDTGLRFSNIRQDYQYEVQGNGITHCRAGLELSHSYIDYSYVLTPAYRVLSDAVINLTCNTMRRVDGFRAGTSIGVSIPYQPVVDYLRNQCSNCPITYFYPGITFDDPAAIARGNANTTYMKNWFDDASVASGGQYIAFQNNQNYTLNYRTYGPNAPSGVQPNSYAQHDDALSIGNKSIPAIGNVPNDPRYPIETATCQYQITPFPAGIQFRGIAGTGRATIISSNELAQNWPNPAESTTTFVYLLKEGTTVAELVLHRAIDGREIQRLPLDLRRTSCNLSVQGWSTGTYFATLVIDGLPGVTRRVVVD